jgi:hypothetical protein
MHKAIYVESLGFFQLESSSHRKIFKIQKKYLYSQTSVTVYFLLSIL